MPHDGTLPSLPLLEERGCFVGAGRQFYWFIDWFVELIIVSLGSTIHSFAHSFRRREGMGLEIIWNDSKWFWICCFVVGCALCRILFSSAQILHLRDSRVITSWSHHHPIVAVDHAESGWVEYCSRLCLHCK